HFAVNSLASGYITPANGINGGAADDTVDFNTTGSVACTWTVRGGGGSDTVNLSPALHNLTNLAGAVSFDGGAGLDTLNAIDDANTNAEGYTITPTSHTRLQFCGAFGHHTVEQLNVSAGIPGDMNNVESNSDTAVVNLRG